MSMEVHVVQEFESKVQRLTWSIHACIISDISGSDGEYNSDFSLDCIVLRIA